MFSQAGIMIIVNHGQIAYMLLPEGWIEKRPESSPDTMVGARSLTELLAPAPGEAKIGLFYRGMAVDPDSAKAFAEILKSPRDELTKQEFNDVSEVLGNIAYPNAYLPTKIATVDHNGRHILWVEGEYPGSQNRTIELFIDCDGTGRYVQQLYFLAPASQFAKEEAMGREILNSIEWLPTE